MATEMPRHTRAADYLLAVHKLSIEGEHATTGLVARAIGVSNGTASSKLKELASEGLLALQPYAGAKLTPDGEAIANSAWQRQRLIELFLGQTLELPPHEAAQQAWAIEVCMSDTTISAIRVFLSQPALPSLSDHNLA